MTETKPAPSPGWYLALHRIGSDFLHVERPERVPDDLKDAPAIYVGPALLSASDWRDLALHYRDSAQVSAFWIPDCRHIDAPGAKIVREELRDALARDGAECVEDDLIDGHAFLVYRRRPGPYIHAPWRKSAKHCLVIRGGAHGDALMASSILPALKAEGWTITFCTVPAGAEVLRHDPHIDEFIVHQPSQIKDADIGPLWRALERRFDRTINLSYAVEHVLLKRPWDGAFHWPAEQRRRACAGSYLRSHHDLAGVPGPYRVKFYPNADEAAKAREQAAKVGPFILWAVRGSGIHKNYPHNVELAVRVLSATDLKLVLSGDKTCLQDEADMLNGIERWLGPGHRERVLSMVDTGSIRRVMALAPLARAVIGPETGVLNAVSLEPVPKLCFLSHSAPSNLTDDWINAEALKPVRAPCWPCHRLFHRSEIDQCPRSADGRAALCQSLISPDEAWLALARLLAGTAAERKAA